MTTMDEFDIQFNNSVVPDGALSLGFISVHLWIDTEGNKRWMVYSTLEGDNVTAVGLLALAQARVIRKVSDRQEGEK